MSLEISTPKIAHVITLPTVTRVQNLVMIAQHQFPPRMGENANQYSSFPFLSFLFLSFSFLGFPSLLYSCSCVELKRLDRLLTFNGLKYVAWRREVPFVCLNHFRPLLG